LGNGPGAERRTVLAVVGVILTVWLVVIFGRAIADSNALSQRLAQESSINAQMRAEVDAGRAEIDFIQTEPFLQFQARADGMGAAGERAFALEPNAPSPPPLTPLGADHPQTDTTTTPLEDWLRLLFGG
jgi:cell division protein FtsB